jgi:uncharacterized membrane protein
MPEVIAVVITVVLSLAFLVLVSAAVAVLVVRLLPGKPTPEDILRERYARGDIDTQQFEEMRRRVTASGGPTPRAA